MNAIVIGLLAAWVFGAFCFIIAAALAANRIRDLEDEVAHWQKRYWTCAGDDL